MVTFAVNAAPPRTVMLSIAQIAARDRVSKQAVSRKVRQLAADHGLTVERDGQGRVRAVNVAEYDHLRGRLDDPSKAQAPESESPDAAPLSVESYDEALRQKTWIEAERARLRLASEIGQLLQADEVADALARCGADFCRAVERLIFDVDEMAATYERGGVHGLRIFVKRIVVRIRKEAADALDAIASENPAQRIPQAAESPQTGSETKEILQCS